MAKSKITAIQVQSPFSFQNVDSNGAKFLHVAENKYFEVMKNPKYSKANKQTLTDFVSYLQYRNSAPRTYQKHMYLYEKLMDCWDQKVVLLEATKLDMERAVAKMNQLGLGDLTISGIKITSKMIFRHFVGDDEALPKGFSKILNSTGVKPNRQLTNASLFSPEEITQVIQNSINSRNAAILSLIFDVPISPQSICALKRRDLALDTDKPYLKVYRSKTDTTHIVYLADSISYLADYVSKTQFDSGDDPLFWRFTWNKKYGSINYAGLNKMFKEACVRAGIAKEKHFLYNARHTVISNLIQAGLDVADLEDQAGWIRGGYGKNSKTYIHTSNEKRAANIYKAKGMPVPDSEKPKSKLLECWRCKRKNLSSDMLYCPSCSAPLSKEAYKRFENTNIATEAMADYLTSKNQKEDLKEIATMVAEILKQKEKHD